MVHSDFMVCPAPDCDHLLAINAAEFDGGVLNVEFECPGCGLEDTIRHEN